MTIRPATPNDLDEIDEIDSVIESSEYLHIEKTGEGAAISLSTSSRPLREKLVIPNRLTVENKFLLKQIVTLIEEGIALVAEHNGSIIASLLAQARPNNQTYELLDLRIDYEYRRQGLATGMIFQLIQTATDAEYRAIHAASLTNNISTARMFDKLGFELSGMDLRRNTNHDLVKEAVTLFWYYEIV